MAKYFILLTVMCLAVPVAQAQFKFGLTAGYETFRTTTGGDMKSSGGFSGGFLLRYTCSRHIELDLALTLGGWKTGPVSSQVQQRALLIPPDPGSGTYLTHYSIIHALAPFYICYVIPLKNYSLFGGPGIFFSGTSLDHGGHMTGYNSSGLSLLAGIRWRQWQVAADYRPWLSHANRNNNGDDFDGKLSDDASLRLGFAFGKTRKKHP